MIDKNIAMKHSAIAAESTAGKWFITQKI